MSAQQAFAGALLADNVDCPPGLMAWNRSDPAGRFAVYRNNVIVGLVDALADTYPVTQELVGEEFFRGMARLFAREQPPRSPVLACYGAELPAFIEKFPPAAGVPYLADVARLEMLRVQAFHAADDAPLALEQITALLADEEGLVASRVRLHPSVRVLASGHAVVSLWAAHQMDDVGEALAAVTPEAAEAALIMRVGLDVEISLIPPGAAVFIEYLLQGEAFGVAAEQALAVEPEFDLAGILGRLIQGGALCAVTTPRSATS